MAQSSMQSASYARANEPQGVTKEQLHELQQYQKILRLRDAVLAGTHPTIKVPPNLLAHVNATTKKSANTTDGSGDHASSTASSEPHPGSSRRDVPVVGSAPAKTVSEAKPSLPEINPIFLEKSEQLVKAELKLQRQRAERALRDEVEQRRPAKHALAELATDIDIPDVLSKALAIVPAVPVATPAVPDSIANSDNRSESFDNNTFYSSQHDTPELQSNRSPRGTAEEAGNTAAAIHDSNEALEDIYDLQSLSGQVVKASAPRTQAEADFRASIGASRPVATVPGLNNYPAQNSNLPRATAQRHLEHNLPPDLGAIRPPQAVFPPNSIDKPLATEAYAEAYPPSPLLQSHDLQPIAPHPVYPANLHVDSSASNSGAPTVTGTPAQVAALRNEPLSATSPDSSPQGPRVPERKRSKKKKRKADRPAVEADVVTVKPEPRSPSPTAALSYIRPNKRQRHSHRQAQDQGPSYPVSSGLALGYDSPGYDNAGAPEPHTGARALYSAQGEPIPVTSVRTGHHPPRPPSSAMHGARRYSGGHVDSRGRVPHAGGYNAYPPQPYSVQEQQEVMYDYIEGSEGFPRAVSHHAPYEASRVSIRPEGNSYAGVSGAQPQRIYVDSTGREYIEPRRPLMRQSVAPVGYYREPEVVYERAPPRTVSRFAEPHHYVDAAASYGPPTQAFVPSRRVLTQPEYVQQSYSAALPSEYARRSMMPPDLHGPEPSGQGYGVRAASTRPPPPPPPPPPTGRFPSSEDYASGPDSRMEPAVRGYGQTPAQSYGWEFEAAPPGHPGSHAAPGPGYYAAPARGAEAISFVEQPRGATQEIIYRNSGHEEAYH